MKTTGPYVVLLDQNPLSLPLFKFYHATSSDFPYASFEKDNYAPLPFTQAYDSKAVPVLVILCLPDPIQPGRKAVSGQRGPREWLAAKIQGGHANMSPGLWCQFSALLPCISTFSSGNLG